MSLAQEIITQTINDVKSFMEEFAKAYITELISGKINGVISDAVDKVIPSDISNGEEDGGDADEKGEGDEKKDEEKSIAAGVHCVGYRSGIGPDRAEHRFYDLACWNIKPKNSVITRVTQRHRVLLEQATNLKKKIPNMPDEIFPKKKMGGKDKGYYKQRFQQIRQYYITISKSQDVTTNEDFLVYFRLQEDSKAELRETFFAALESVCESAGINWQNCKRKAERLGLDVEPVEMLKVVAVAKVGREASSRVRQEVANKTPNFVPTPAKNKFINVAETKLAQAISSTVETGWEASSKTFDEITSKLSDTLDKALDPLKEIISKALDPIGNFVQEKFAKAKDLLPKKDDKEDDPMVGIDRFPPFESFLKLLKDNSDKSIKEAGLELIKSVDKMMDCWNYVCYLRYPLGEDKDIVDWFPFIDEIQDNHYRLTICLTDACYILTHAAIKSFIPLFEYVDRASKEYDEKQHEKELRIALRAGGRSLAVEYYNLPSSLERTLWYCGKEVNDNTIALCEETIRSIADILGNIAITWKPSSKDDVKKTFYDVVLPLLNDFVNDRVATWLSIVQDSTQELISNKFLDICKAVINEVANTLNDAMSALPDPIGKSIKPGNLLKTMANKLAKNASAAICKKLSENSRKALYDKDSKVDPCDEWSVRRLRWAPIIKDENDEEGLDEDEDEGEKKEPKQSDADGIASGDEADNGEASPENKKGEASSENKKGEASPENKKDEEPKEE